MPAARRRPTLSAAGPDSTPPPAPVTMPAIAAPPGRVTSAGWLTLVLELGLHGGCGMDADQLGLARAEVGEAVWDIRRPDHDVARPAFDGFVAPLDRGAARQDHEGLVLRVVVQLRALARIVVHQEERHRRWPVCAA